MVASVYSRALSRAAELLGSREKLAKVLQIPAVEIDKWIADQGKPPREIFLRIVDLILDETRSGSDSDPQEPPPPRDAAGSSQRYLD
ncbi:MAG TPA: hypothetical protein VE085_02730 [Burkholderiales bacterium]|nr:hypothetical protein [Burkholderiales bacterium]